MQFLTISYANESFSSVGSMIPTGLSGFIVYPLANPRRGHGVAAAIDPAIRPSSSQESAKGIASIGARKSQGVMPLMPGMLTTSFTDRQDVELYVPTGGMALAEYLVPSFQDPGSGIRPSLPVLEPGQLYRVRGILDNGSTDADLSQVVLVIELSAQQQADQGLSQPYIYVSNTYFDPGRLRHRQLLLNVDQLQGLRYPSESDGPNVIAADRTRRSPVIPKSVSTSIGSLEDDYYELVTRVGDLELSATTLAPPGAGTNCGLISVG